MTALNTNLARETVLVTGATSGLGRAAAIHLARTGLPRFRGRPVWRAPRRLEATARERQFALTTLEMDVRDDASVDRAMAQIEAAGAPVDVLINNAGVAYVVPVEEIRIEDLREQFETNVFGAVRVTQRVLPTMRARGRGRIINMSSLAGRLAFPLFGAYSGSKFALEGMTDALRLEVYPFGIDVVLIEPGYIPTAMEQTAVELASGYRENLEHGPYANVYRTSYEPGDEALAAREPRRRIARA